MRHLSLSRTWVTGTLPVVSLWLVMPSSSSSYYGSTAVLSRSSPWPSKFLGLGGLELLFILLGEELCVYLMLLINLRHLWCLGERWGLSLSPLLTFRSPLGLEKVMFPVDW